MRGVRSLDASSSASTILQLSESSAMVEETPQLLEEQDQLLISWPCEVAGMSRADVAIQTCFSHI